MAVSSPLPSDNSAIVQPFLQPNFDPAEYLNFTLPPLALTSTSHARSGKTAVPLSDLSAQLQTLLTQLNAQTSRLSNTLTQLTDDILRSGSRLAYEVEVLGGEATGLTDTLENGLKKDLDTFTAKSTHREDEGQVGESSNGDPQKTADQHESTSHQSGEPEFLDRLRTLTTTRERLDSVIKTFGSAMQWPIAPSELSLTSSLISVSAPESTDDTRSREEKGKDYVEQLRNEINDLLATGREGLEAANTRVEELRVLAGVFKGTAEEKARLKVVESMQRVIDDKQRTLGSSNGQTRRVGASSPAPGYDHRYGTADSSRLAPEGGSGYGFLQNLRNLKN